MELFERRKEFNSVMEQAFRQEMFLESTFRLRITFAVFMLLYGSFGFMDRILAPENARFFFLIRFGLVLPVFFLTILATFHGGFPKWHQMIYLLNFVMAGAGIALMLLVLPGNITYYGGFFMILFSGYFLLRLQFTYASVGGWGVTLFYLTGLVYVQGEIPSNLVCMILFFVGSNVIGMIGSYNIELYGRRNFIQKDRINKFNRTLRSKVQEQVGEITASQIGTIYALARLVESRDKETASHIERVGKYCRILAEALPREAFKETGIEKERFVEIIEVASALHDIGKVGVPDHILNKAGSLTGEEFDMMKRHAAIGGRTLESVRRRYPNNDFINMGIEITRSHHENYDGTGYPDGLEGGDIPLSAKIMAIADVYDALVSRRPYKMPYSHERAVEIIAGESGGKFEPLLVELFLKHEETFRNIAERMGDENGVA